MDEYRSSRSTLRCEEELETKSGRVYIHSHHLAITLDLLKHQVLHHYFTKATATMETVAMAMDQVPDVMLKVGVAVLRQDGCGYRQTLQMLKHMFTWQYSHREDILLDTALFIAGHGNIQEAYDTLQSQISGEPFKSNWKIHGYSGMFKYYTYREKEAELETDGELLLEEGEGVVYKGRDMLVKQALHHFTIMKGHSPPHSSVVMDTFIRIYSELLIKQGLNDEALELLIWYKDHGPFRMAPYRLVCDHIRTCDDDDAMLIHHLTIMADMEDSIIEAIELAKLLLKRDDGVIVWKQVFELIVKYLDYPSNRTNSEAWTLLQQVQGKWSDYKASDLWTQRLHWWKYLYQP